MHIAITGATGNIGVRLVERLIAEPGVTTVTGVARRPPSHETRSKVRWVSSDLSKADAAAQLGNALAGVDVVVHLAWLIQPSHRPAEMRATNVDGSAHLLEAVTQAGVKTIVHSSSLGVYSPGPDKKTLVPESWARRGIPGSLYSQHKVEVEDLLDTFESEHSEVRVVRVRPAVVVQREAAAEQARYFLGRLIPPRLIRRGLIPVLPLPSSLITQVVHAEDIADLFARAALTPTARGSYNGAADDLLTPQVIAKVFHAQHVPVPEAVLRVLAEATWRLRLQPTDRGWVELALRSPLMSSTRANDELGWRPRHTAESSLAEALEGIAGKTGGPTPVLARNQ